MKKALTSLLLLFLLGGQVGMLGALIGRHHARQQMHQKVAAVSGAGSDEGKAQHLALSRADRHAPSSSFVRMEEGEFRYQGALYDVVREKWRGDVWHVWVIHDREEEQYLDVLDRTTRSPTLDSEAVLTHQHPLGYRPVAPVPAAWVSPPAPPLHTRSFPRASITRHEAPYLEVPHPPPWG